jgi:hypothetical protein
VALPWPPVVEGIDVGVDARILGVGHGAFT